METTKMKEFFENLKNKIYEAVKTDIKPILKEVGDERIYAVALVTDSDCTTLYLALNTYEYMKQRDEEFIERYKEEFKDEVSEEAIKMVREGRRYITKWDYEEWGYSDGKNSQLAKVSEVLFKQEELNSEEYGEHQEEFFKAVTSAFKRIVDEKILGKDSDKITYFISISDDERTPEIEDESAKALNSEDISQVFLERTHVLE